MADIWLTSLLTESPQEGYDLAVKLSRMAVKMAQPDVAIRIELREVYERDANALTAISAVVATNFQTVSAANNYWRKTQ